MLQSRRSLQAQTPSRNIKTSGVALRREHCCAGAIKFAHRYHASLPSAAIPPSHARGQH